MTTFCWLPPESVDDRVLGAADLDLQLARAPPSIAAPRAGLVDEGAAARRRSRRRRAGCRRSTSGQHQALGLAVLGDQRDAGPAGLRRARARRARRAASPTRTSPSTPRSTPKSASSSSFWPWPSRPPRPTISPRPTARSTPLRRFSQRRSSTVEQRRRARPHGLRRELRLDVAADHQPDDLAAVRAPLAKVSMWRPLRKTEQRVAERLDLVHPVRDEDRGRRPAPCRSAQQAVDASRRRGWSAPRSPRRGSAPRGRGRCALAISTICRRDRRQVADQRLAG